MSEEAPVNIHSDSDEGLETVGVGSQSSIGAAPKRGFSYCQVCGAYRHWKTICCSARAAETASAAATAAYGGKTLQTQEKGKETAFDDFDKSSTVTGIGEIKKFQCGACLQTFVSSHGLAVHRGRMQCRTESEADERANASSKSSINITYLCRYGCGRNLLSEPDRNLHHKICYKNVKNEKYHDDASMSADLPQVHRKELATRAFPDAQRVAASLHGDVSSYKQENEQKDMTLARKERAVALYTRLEHTLQEIFALQGEGIEAHLPRMQQEQQAQFSSQSLQDRQAQQNNFVERGVKVVKRMQEEFAGEAFDALVGRDFSLLQKGSKMRRT